MVYPGMSLCLIEFDDGYDTNDHVPDDVLENPRIDAAQWWNEENKDDYIPLIKGVRKAVRVTKILYQ